MSSKIANESAWRLFPTPEVLDDLLVEIIDRNKTNPERIVPGTPHPDRSLYPGFILADEKPVDGTDNIVRRYWTNELSNQDAYNYSINYSSESASHPIWARRYLVRRDRYTEPVYGEALTGVFLVKVTNGGTGYDKAPSVTFTGGSGSGASAVAIVNNGSVAWVRITAEGTGYTAAPTVAFVGGSGTGAAATAVVQGGAKLVHQELQELPADDPRRSVFVAMARVWETLPGPVLTSIEYNRSLANGAKTTVTSQRVLAATADTVTPTFASGVLDSKVTAIDAVVSRLETIRLATGVRQPILYGTHIDEATGICVDYTKQFVAAGVKGGIGHVRSITISNGGTGYTNGDHELVFSGGGGAYATAYATIAGGIVTSVTVTFGGSGYTSAPTVALPGSAGAGSSAAFTVAVGKGYVEIQPFDDKQSVAITSCIRDGLNGTGTSTIPADKVYAVTSRESFPLELRNITLFNVSGTTARVGYDGYSYSGEVYGRITRKYMTDAAYQTWTGTSGGVPGDLFANKPDLVQFFPQANRVEVEIASVKMNAGAFPESLHAGVVDSAFGTGVVATLPATTPTEVPHGDWIVKSIKEEQWRFGYWLVEILEIKVPSY